MGVGPRTAATADRMMNHLSLFSGIGGLDIAAQWAGMQTVAFVERDPYCQRVLAKHWPGIPIYGDIHEVTDNVIRGIGRIDIISGGFPCQPFSQAGKRAGQSDDRYLWPEMLRIIDIAGPRWVVGENVTGIINMALDDVLADLEAKGYEARTIVFPACAVGAPHIRSRVSVVAYATITRNRRLSVRSRGSRQEKAHIDRGGENVSDTKLTQWPERTWDAKSMDEETSDQPRGCGWDSEVESELGRVADGIPHRVDRLRALGNAVVPQQAYQVFKLIAQLTGL